MLAKAHKAAGARLCRVLAFAWASFAPQAFAFDSPLRSVAWHQLDALSRAAVVIGCVVVPLFMLCMLVAGGRKERRLGLALVGVLALLWGSYARLAGTVWYMRPVEGTYGTSDGTSYASAFDGPADIVWGPGGVEAGDTLYSCGTFNTGSGSTYWLTAGASGSSGLPITISGDCSAQGDLSRSVWDGDNVRVAAFTSNTQIYLNIQSLEIRDFTTRGLYLTNTTGPDQTVERYINVDDVYIWDIQGNAGASPTGITVQGRYVTVTNSRLEECGDDCVSVRGKYFTARGLQIATPGRDTTTGDCVALGGSSAELDGYLLEDISCDHTSEDEKQCIVVSLSADNPSGRISRLVCEMPIGGTVGVGVLVDAGNYVIERSWIRGGLTGISVGNASTYAGRIESNILISQSQDGIKNDFGFANQTVTQSNNTILNAGRYGINADCNHATCTTNTYNNAVIGAGTACLRTLNTTFTHKNNLLYGCGTPYMVATTPTTPDASTIEADPQFIGGSSPTTPEGFRLSASSPLAAAGTDLGDEISDYFGDNMYNGQWDIGAFRRDSCYRRSRDGKLDMARTRAQVVSRCRGMPPRYPEGL